MSPLYEVEQPHTLPPALPNVKQRNIFATEVAPACWLLGVRDALQENCQVTT
jgi:hypothetical protein